MLKKYALARSNGAPFSFEWDVNTGIVSGPAAWQLEAERTNWDPETGEIKLWPAGELFRIPDPFRSIIGMSVLLYALDVEPNAEFGEAFAKAEQIIDEREDDGSVN